METFLQDVRYGVRWLTRNPGFTVIAVFALALGIGANSAIFSVINALLFKPYPFKNLDRIVMIQESLPNQSLKSKAVSAADFIDWQSQSKFFENLAGYKIRDITITGITQPELVRGSFVSPNFFTLFEIKPFKGRNFLEGEDEPGRDQVVVLSHSLWKSHFASDPNVLNKSITLNSRATTVIGIMPAQFNFPFGTDLWMPLALTPQQKSVRTLRNLYVLADLKPGVTVKQAQAEMSTVAKRIEQQFPETNKGLSVDVILLRDQQAGFTAPMLSILIGMSALLLLVACANVANLLLARATTRRKEIAIRASMSASRWRVIRQLLTESLLLSLLASSIGLLFAVWSIDLIKMSLPPDVAKFMAGWKEIRIDSTVLLFTFGVAFLTTLVFSLAPALQVTRLDLFEVLKEESGRGSSGSIHGRRLRNILVAVEVSMALVLLVGAGLMVQGFWRILNTYQNANPQTVLTIQTPLPEFAYSEPQQQSQFYQRAIENMRVLPEVKSISVASNTPLNNSPNPTMEFIIEGKPPLQPGQRQISDVVSIGPEYFDMVGAKLQAGRDFKESDNFEAPRVAIVTELMASRYWRNEDPVGKRIQLTSSASLQWITIVGVASDLKQSWFDKETRPQIFFSYLQAPRPKMTFLLRTSGSPLSIVKAARAKILAVDRNQPLDEIKTLAQLYIDEGSPLRFAAVLMLVFGILALILSAVGVYGVMSYSVAQRTREIGIRTVFGAAQGDVLRLILSQGMKTVLLGLILGLPLSFALSKLMATALFGIVALQYAVFLIFALLLVFIAFLSTYFPAHRAANVDPIAALRYE
jgi:putative ABC transport system permease protein